MKKNPRKVIGDYLVEYLPATAYAPSMTLVTDWSGRRLLHRAATFADGIRWAFAQSEPYCSLTFEQRCAFDAKAERIANRFKLVRKGL